MISHVPDGFILRNNWPVNDDNTGILNDIDDFQYMTKVSETIKIIFYKK